MFEKFAGGREWPVHGCPRSAAEIAGGLEQIFNGCLPPEYYDFVQLAPDELLRWARRNENGPDEVDCVSSRGGEA